MDIINDRRTGALIGATLLLLTVLLGARGALAAPSDPWITTKAKIALLTAKDVHASAINVDTIDGQVTLHGRIASQAEKTKAGTTVRAIEGVRGVRNLLQVMSERREKQIVASDAELKANVEEALAGREPLADISVASVNSGVVLLAGDVTSLSAHLWAIELASRVPGVRQVATEIKSPSELGDEELYAERSATPPERGISGATSDMWTTAAVKLRLLADSRTPALDVNVDTTGDTVTLFGIVNSAETKAAAEEEARKVAGVNTVVNGLQVVPAEAEDAVKAVDDDVKEHVEAALSQQGELRDADIDVDVSNGVARLTGSVPTQSQRLTAAVVARTTGGVRAVRDDLQVVEN